jgi:predicted lactoylglutathione lyase
MATKIFVNLPVSDLHKSKEFYTKIGFSINPQFSDETAACVVISENIYAMILTHDKFKQFTPKEIADSTKTSEVLTALSFESKEKVNEVADKAISSGGSEARAAFDYGFMYGRSFNDPDGHIWEAFWMDMNAAPPQPQNS